jgi:glycosyltransferase involved in cell wall biosynthesis
MIIYPKLSVITVVFNSVNFIEKTILSVISQNFKDYEFIIIDAGSKDGTIEIIKKYQDKITLWVSEPDNGIYDAMNKGVNLSNGQFIQFLNAGDIFINSNTLYNVSECLKMNSDISLFGYLIENKIYQSDFSFSGLLGGMPCHQAIFYKRDYLIKSPFNIKFKFSADYHNLLNGIFSHSVLAFNITAVIYDTNGISSNFLIKRNIRMERLNSVYISKIPFYWKIPMLMYNILRLIKLR